MINDKFQKITLGDEDYLIIDSIQNLRAEDSFIHPQNKLALHYGSGEARKYVGSYKGKPGKRLSEFFEYSNWGNTKQNGKRTYPKIQINNCFFSKHNLNKYLNDSKVEYHSQEQVYKQDISTYYSERLDSVNSLANDKIYFSIYDVSDFTTDKLSRAYIRSDDKIWKLWRLLVLPKISYLSILKLIPNSQKKSNKILFYFRILLDYQFRSIVHPQLNIGSLKENSIVDFYEPKRSPAIREGQQKFRKSVIDHMPQCPFTKLSDERLLIASHIKPYSICMNENEHGQAIDYYNGLSLSPTYDKLFDQGYITFTNEGELICGTQLTPYTWERLNINPNAKNLMRIYPEKREDYLEYHRKNVFQDDLSELN